MQRCPYCGQMIQMFVIQCPYCQQMLPMGAANNSILPSGANSYGQAGYHFPFYLYDQPTATNDEHDNGPDG
ncbi:hypothetical protein [Limosilactobacillus equigenerosi]|uniref:hypothetical protein n=1 Tax=Limosilactobacillus equigenerosi TaxID=417373 RepID=UPI0006D1B68A|nr:hypothetical protein [Limosilactobacillus equigenerosi]